MQAIILAAGMGKRLGLLTKESTKCMVKVNNITLIDRMLDQLANHEIEKIIIVVGYQGKKLREYIDRQARNVTIEYIENPIYDKTNNIYSLSLAKEKLQEDDTLLIESDLIFEDSIFDLILQDPYPDLALVAKYEPWMDGTMTVLDEDNYINSFVPKQNLNYNNVDTYYKTLNIYKFSKEFSRNRYVPFLEAYSKTFGNNEYYEQVLRVLSLLDKTGLKGLPLNNEKWYEIDDAQDLDIAETLFADSNNMLSMYQKRYGGYWRFPKLLDFCYLVNPFFPPKQMKNELRANFDTLLTEYPSGLKINSMLISKNFGINYEYTCVGNGAAELIKSLMDAIDGKIGIVLPTFEEYPNRKNPDEIVTFLPSNKNFTYSASDIINYFSDKDIKNLLLINPDNPSGNFIPFDDLISIISWAEKFDIKLIIDESFVDFSEDSEENSLLRNDILEKYSNLIVVKSISKSYGVPGLRLGLIATSNLNLLNQIKKGVSIWNINSFAEYYLQIFSKYDHFYKKATKDFIIERDRFHSNLKQIEFLRIIPSQANYFLCEVCGTYTSSELTSLLLNKYNILVKDCMNKTGFTNGNYIRIAIRNKKDNDKIVECLKNLNQ